MKNNISLKTIVKSKNYNQFHEDHLFFIRNYDKPIWFISFSYKRYNLMKISILLITIYKVNSKKDEIKIKFLQ